MLIAGRDVPYGNAGSSKQALSQMLNCTRFFSDFGWFFTVNPVMHDYPLALRIGLAGSVTALDNWSDPTGQDFQVPLDGEERRSIIDKHPLGAVLGYMRLVYSVLTHLLVTPFPKPGMGTLSNLRLPSLTPEPSQFFRGRGCFGPLSGYFVAQESSKSLAQHMHGIGYSPLNWTFIRKIAQHPELNAILGKFIDSIQVSGLSDTQWESKDLPWEPPTLGKRCPPTPMDLDGDGAFVQHCGYVMSHKQDHEPHNHSCWKNVSREVMSQTEEKTCVKCDGKYDDGKCHCNLCRFRYPQKCSNKESGIVEIILVTVTKEPTVDDSEKSINCNSSVSEPGSKTKPETFRRVFSKLSPSFQLPQVGKFPGDHRILVHVQQRPSSSHAVVDTHEDRTRRQMDDPKLLDNDLNPMGRNGMFVNCSRVVSAATTSQNDLQITSPQGLGGACYIADYITKGDGVAKLNNTLPLFYEALQTSKNRPSVASDAATNPLRPAMRVLTRLINNKMKSSEFGLRCALSSLLGLKQFTSSHFVRHARGQILSLQETNRSVLEKGVDQSVFDERDAISERTTSKPSLSGEGSSSAEILNWVEAGNSEESAVRSR